MHNRIARYFAPPARGQSQDFTSQLVKAVQENPQAIIEAIAPQLSKHVGRAVAAGVTYELRRLGVTQ